MCKSTLPQIEKMFPWDFFLESAIIKGNCTSCFS